MAPAPLPMPWREALLAIAPGALAVIAATTPGFAFWAHVGPALLAAYLLSGYWWSGRRVPAWSLMAAGMLASVALTTAAGVAGALAALLLERTASVLVLLLLLGALAAILARAARSHRVPRMAWVLLALIVACQLAVRAKYFLFYGTSWAVAGQWLSISLYAVTSALLLPVALGLPLARRYGVATTLFAVGMVYGGFQILIDVNRQVSDQIGGTAAFLAYAALIPLLFVVAAPLCFVRVRALRSRVGGLLAIVGLAVILDLVVVGLAYGDALPPIIWISFAPYTASVLLALALAILLYRNVPQTGAPSSAPDARQSR